MYTTYLAQLDSHKLTLDLGQEAVIHRLYLLHLALLAHRKTKERKVMGIFRRRKAPLPPRGLYIYGDVGRGKSMVMDLFFETIPLKKKRRVHFHAFMLEVHAAMHAHRQEQARAHQHKANSKHADPIPPVAGAIAATCELLCFDELQVTDIADAMILGRLFKELFARGVTVVATSNRPPDDLYLDGLQREQFLPFIAMLKQKLHVVHLGSPYDYRMEQEKSVDITYFSPLGPPADRFIERKLARLADGIPASEEILEIQGRSLAIPHSYGDTALFSFDDLCAKPLGAADYIALTKRYNRIILKDIPRLTPDKRNEAKRFVTLIDELYEHHTLLICTAETTPDKLYPTGSGAFEFERTVSRLIEMQSENYTSHV